MRVGSRVTVGDFRVQSAALRVDDHEGFESRMPVFERGPIPRGSKRDLFEMLVSAGCMRFTECGYVPLHISERNVTARLESTNSGGENALKISLPPASRSLEK